jgi:hypothetical protein
MTEGRFSSGGSPIEDEDLLLTKGQKQEQKHNTAIGGYLLGESGDSELEMKGKRITCRLRLTLDQ